MVELGGEVRMRAAYHGNCDSCMGQETRINDVVSISYLTSRDSDTSLHVFVLRHRTIMLEPRPR
jgi:hypothetical protein